MSLLKRLEAKFGRYAVPNLTVILIAGQVAILFLSYLERQGAPINVSDRLLLDPSLVMKGEVWRLATFLFLPPFTNLFFALFFWMGFYVCGTTLEREWGDFRYNAYVLVGYAATLIVAFCYPDFPQSNYFLKATVFLAFARMNPDFAFSIYGIIPIPARLLALLIWAYLAHSLWIGPWPERLGAIASIFNYMLFFGRDIWQDLKHRRRRARFQSHGPSKGHAMGRSHVIHTCRVCGITSESSPKTQFRYCSQCGGDVSYCPEHLHDHEHVVAQKV